MAATSLRLVDTEPTPPLDLSPWLLGARLPPEQIRGLGLAAIETLDPDDTSATRALLFDLVRVATGVRLDPAVAWSGLQLAQLGCEPSLAAELALLLPRPVTPADLASVLRRGPAEMPARPPEALAPTVEINLADWW